MRITRRFWIDSALSGASATLLILTLAWHNWIELAFGLDPDRGSGQLEWLIVVAAVAGTVLGCALAGAEWRRMRADV